MRRRRLTVILRFSRTNPARGFPVLALLAIWVAGFGLATLRGGFSRCRGHCSRGFGSVVLLWWLWCRNMRVCGRCLRSWF
ncbi:hypothetical protein QBC40DRAFT_291322 [Triangularia verruculosa]|uniref:Uncharacterized protein n=1 Tax=Triangularia verruculosa TaxID=2587418 RepID=A0AAN6X4X7_9PEZI|nr:hypothetical protein QBC40DRAFT_291322 [Triangularia verruculosa]